MEKITVSSIRKLKNREPIVMLTAYDALFSAIFDEFVDILLVGDSLNMSFNGSEDTISATLDMMIYHTKAVCSKRKRALVVTDMPFGSYINKDIALQSAIRVYQETKADAIKIEGGVEKAEIVKHLCENSIAIMGHIGLMPQFVRADGGYKIKGKSDEEIAKLLDDAKAIESAGAFAIVLEGVKSEVAKVIQEAVNVPIIGIGAGKDVDGQVLVWSDMLGLFGEFKPKFVKEYLNGLELVKNAISNYSKEVKAKEFPTKEFSY